MKTGSGWPGEGSKLVTRGRRNVDLESGRALVRVCVPCCLHSPSNTDGLSVFRLVADGEKFSTRLQFEESGRSLVVSNGCACWPWVQQKTKRAAHSTTEQLLAFSHLHVEPRVTVFFVNQVYSPQIKRICNLVD